MKRIVLYIIELILPSNYAIVKDVTRVQKVENDFTIYPFAEYSLSRGQNKLKLLRAIHGLLLLKTGGLQNLFPCHIFV